MERPSFYQLRLQSQGGLALPAAVIAELGIQEGDELLLLRDEGGFRLTPREALLETMIGSLARDDGRDLTEEFLEDRRREAREKGW